MVCLRPQDADFFHHWMIIFVFSSLVRERNCFFTLLAGCLRGLLSGTNEYMEKHPLLCVYWTLHLLTEGANGFHGKGLLATAGSCDAFFKKQFRCPLHWRWTGRVDTTGTTRDGVQNPNPTLAVGLSCPPQKKKDLVPRLAVSTCSVIVGSSMCFLQNSHSEQCMGGDVCGCGCETQGSETEEAPSVRWWLGLQASLPDGTGSACLGVPHLLSGGKLLNGVQTCHFIASPVRENVQGDRSVKIEL